MRHTLTSATALVLAMLLGVPAPAAATAEADVDTVGVVDLAQGRWSLWDPLRGSESFYYGNPGDYPFLGDWDCDGTDTPGLYRQSDGYVYLRNSNSQGVADLAYYFGNPDDEPLPGDFDGDGCDTVSLYRPSEGRFYIVNELAGGGAGLGPADFSFSFGDLGDVPFVGDFDGDGIDSFGLHRRSTGTVYVRNSLTTGPADRDFAYGNAGDLAFAGNWSGRGIDTVGILRPGSVEFHLRLANGPGVADQVVLMDQGGTAMIPVAGNVGRAGMVPFQEYPCGATPPGGYIAWGGMTGRSPAPAAPSDAVGVLGMSFTASPDCDRTVITLAGPIASSPPYDVPANRVPGGVAVFGRANRFHVDLPSNIVQGPGRNAGYFGEPFALIVRGSGPARALYVEVFHPGFRRGKVFFLAHPARIVIDSIPDTGLDWLRLGPVRGDFAHLREPIDLTGNGVTTPVRVTGYARPFEGSDVASLSDASTGKPVAATWTGCSAFPDSDGSFCVYSTSGDQGAWGEVSFTIADVAPGTYELFVSGWEDVEFGMRPNRGVTDTFTVLGTAGDLCPARDILPVVKASLDLPGVVTIEEVRVVDCRAGYARVFAVPTPADPAQSFETEQVFLHEVGGAWYIVTFGTGIDCATETDWDPSELADACWALGLR